MAKDNDETRELSPLFGDSMVEVTDGSALMKAMEATADEGGRMGDISFMSFSGKRGVYSIGVDKREPGTQEPFLVAIPSFELGWMCWKGGKPAAKRMATITQPKITEPDMEEHGPFDDRRGEGWFRARAITVRSLETEEQCYFSINSKSGVSTLSDLQKEVLERMRAGQPCWPIVYFDREEFESQGYKNFKPLIEIGGWVTTEQVSSLANPDVNPMSLLEDAPEEEKEKIEEKKDAPAPKPRRRL